MKSITFACSALFFLSSCGELETSRDTAAEFELRGCEARFRSNCVGGAVYWFDSCGVQGELIETCRTAAQCVSTAEGASCDPDCIPGARGSCEPHERCALQEGKRRCLEVCPPAWVVLEPGHFRMGVPATEIGRIENREYDPPVREVTLTGTTCMMEAEVTQADYTARVGSNPSSFGSCPDCPVETVSWHEAAQYANLLSQDDGLAPCYACSDGVCEVLGLPNECTGYRLPTEAEWEYAARAGTLTANYLGDLEYVRDCCGMGCWLEVSDALFEGAVWCCGESDHRTQPVKQLAPNPWGLYDILGNVEELCNDNWGRLGADPAVDPFVNDSTRSWRVRRGCTWSDRPWYCRAGVRVPFIPSSSEWGVGFRLVRSLPTK